MITLTARDIIKQAKWLSNTTNSPLSDFYINTNLLSSLYRDLYDDLVDNDNSFVQTANVTGEYYLGDIYKVLYVGDNYGNELTRSSLRTRQTGGYYIENNTIYLPHNGTYILKYCTLPQTITAPDDYVEITPTLTELMKNYAVDSDGILSESEPKFWHGSDIDFSNLPSFIKRDDADIKNVNVSDPYMFVSYSDGKVRLYTDENDYTDFNPNVERGKYFKGYILGFTSDDSTGKGIVYHDDVKDKYYYGSFVPNTVLSYPNNTFFTLLIYRLAAILASMVGLDNPYLTNTLLPQAETTFYKSISKGKAVRTANVQGMTYVRR